jgi:hypothetical protein
MHRPLHLQEVVAIIVGHLLTRHRNATLAALARTCHAFTDPALDALWEQPSLWYLAKTMSENLWTIEIDELVLIQEDIEALHTLVRARATEVSIIISIDIAEICLYTK